jgi:Domain of unknown function (DUF397)
MEILGQGWRKSSYTGNGGANCVEVSVWRKSSYSGNGGGTCVEVGTAWRKSSHSGNGGSNCVEVARDLPRVVAVRDSKDRGGPVLPHPPQAWQASASSVKGGRARTNSQAALAIAGVSCHRGHTAQEIVASEGRVCTPGRRLRRPTS